MDTIVSTSGVVFLHFWVEVNKLWGEFPSFRSIEIVKEIFLKRHLKLSKYPTKYATFSRYPASSELNGHGVCTHKNSNLVREMVNQYVKQKH